MPWTLTDDVDLYAARVWPLLARDPVLHTLPLTVIETLRTGHRWSAEPIVLAWFTADGPADGPRDVPADGASGGASGGDRPVPVIGAASMTPPYDLLVPVVPPGAMAGLVDVLRAAGVAVPGVRGRTSQVADFAARWCSGAAGRGSAGRGSAGRGSAQSGTAGWGPPIVVAAHGERQRLYSLDQLAPPIGVVGRARLATVNDLEVVTEFWGAFQVEAGVPRGDAAQFARARIDGGLVWLWEVDGNGTEVPVSMAGRNPIAAGVARVGPVYTPPEHRRHGYGAAVTAAATQSALDAGARDVVLFTDLANPTSNSVYQSIGYRSVSDFQTIVFT